MQGFLGLLCVDVLDAEQHKRAGPVDGLRHRRCLLQVDLADGAHDSGDLVGQVLGDTGNLGEHDLLLAVHLWVVDVEEQATTLERLGQLAGVVRRKKHERDLRGGNGAKLRDGHLILGEDFEQQCFGLDLDAVNFVDQKHHGLFGRDGFKQGASEQELIGEDVVRDLVPAIRRSVSLDAKELLLIVPLVQRLRLVEALVTLQTNEAGADHVGHALG